MTEEPLVHVVVVTWNNASTIAACLASLSRQRGARIRITVVDNASEDGTPTIIDAVPNVELLRSPCNVGFARAANDAARTIGRDVDYVLLLNPDTQLVGDAVIARAERVFASSDEVGTVGVRTLNPDGSVQPSAFAEPTLWRETTEALFIYRLLPRRLRARLLAGSHWTHDHERVVGWLLGAFLLIRRECWNELGGLTEDFHMFAEDVDWGVRSRRHGWRSVFTPAAEIIHAANTSGRQRWATTRSLVSYSSYYRFLRTRYSGARELASLSVNTLGFGIRFIIYFLRAASAPEGEAVRWREEYQRLLWFHLEYLGRRVRGGEPSATASS